MEFSVNSGIQIPVEYQGREQTFIKHRVLHLYIQSWAQKIASTARRFGSGKVRLWYVDCFSGPWKSVSQALEDTSIHIGLSAIQEAAEFWQARGFKIELGAIFVEKEKTAYARLKEYLTSRQDRFPVNIHAMEGEFGDKVDQIEALIKDDPAFLFVDPTGWKGAAMRFIAPLARKPRRDVMINVMYDYVNRFKDLDLNYVRQQMSDFFDSDVPGHLNEEDLIGFYREQLRKACGVPYAADLTVQDPCRDRTKFRLVLGTHHEAALVLFRNVEKQVLGGEAPAIRTAAKEADRLDRTNQLALLPPCLPIVDLYSEIQKTGFQKVEVQLAKILEEEGPQHFKTLRPRFLQECHISESDLKSLLWQWKSTGRLQLQGLEPRERSVQDEHILESFKTTTANASSTTILLQGNLFETVGALPG